MYIRDIARQLYRLKRQLEQLEQALEAQQPGEDRDSLERQLAKVRAEHEKVRSILEGAKESPLQDTR